MKKIIVDFILTFSNLKKNDFKQNIKEKVSIAIFLVKEK